MAPCLCVLLLGDTKGGQNIYKQNHMIQPSETSLLEVEVTKITCNAAGGFYCYNWSDSTIMSGHIWCM